MTIRRDVAAHREWPASLPEGVKLVDLSQAGRTLGTYEEENKRLNAMLPKVSEAARAPTVKKDRQSRTSKAGKASAKTRFGEDTWQLYALELAKRAKKPGNTQQDVILDQRGTPASVGLYLLICLAKRLRVNDHICTQPTLCIAGFQCYFKWL